MSKRTKRLPAKVSVAAIALTAAANIAANRLLPPGAAIPANLGTAGLLTWFARREGATWSDMGMEPSKIPNGIKWGLKASLPIVAVVAAGVAIPATRHFFADEQIVGASTGDVLFEVLIKIPIGTALAEEILFRGALLGIFERRRSRRIADALSGVMYGLWHVLPTISQLDTNPAGNVVGNSTVAKAGVVGGIVLLTAVAGYGFAWLRDRSESVAAPVIAHTALNVSAYLGGRVAAGLLGISIGP